MWCPDDVVRMPATRLALPPPSLSPSLALPPPPPLPRSPTSLPLSLTHSLSLSLTHSLTDPLSLILSLSLSLSLSVTLPLEVSLSLFVSVLLSLAIVLFHYPSCAPTHSTLLIKDTGIEDMHEDQSNATPEKNSTDGDWQRITHSLTCPLSVIAPWHEFAAFFLWLFQSIAVHEWLLANDIVLFTAGQWSWSEWTAWWWWRWPHGAWCRLFGNGKCTNQTECHRWL